MKSIFLSKTIWVFFVLFIGSILNITGIVTLDLSPDAGWLSMVISVIGIVLRLITKEPINWDSSK
jgi:small-conductance mechanosensitive channel